MAKFLEFLGPSGVGKSTLRSQILLNSDPNDMVSFETASALAHFKHLQRDVFRFLNKGGHINLISDFYIQKQFESFWLEERPHGDDLLDTYAILLDDALQNTYCSDRPLHLKLQITRFLEILLYKHYAINRNVNIPQYILMDEGIIMNLRGIQNVNLESLKNIKEIFPRIIVNCFATKDVVCYRYIKRAFESGVTITNREAEFAYDVTNNRTKEILKQLRKLEIKILDFDMEIISDSKVKNLMYDLSSILHE